MEYKVPLFYPYQSEKIRQAVDGVLRTRWIGQGPKVEEFEKKFAEKFRLRNALAVNSGTSALELAYDLRSIGTGDEVITPVLTCTATNIPLLRRKAKIVFADVRKDTLCVDPEDIRRKITKKTKLIVNVNLGGIKSDIGTNWPVPILNDSAQAMGFGNGDYVAFSFQAIKHFSTGDGGMLVCPNQNIYKRAKKLRWFGIDRDKKRAYDWQAYKKREMTFDIEEPGWKYHMNDIAAAMGLAGLSDYERILSLRRRIFNLYLKKIDGLKGLKLITGKENVCWLATILVEDRDSFARAMKDRGIETNLVQVRNDLFKIFGGKRQKLPNMNEIEDKYISIPLNPHMTIEDARYVVNSIKRGW